MATWKKAIKKRENGEDVEMQLPEIVSASRSTDIPAFYADWFFHRLKKVILHGLILLMECVVMFLMKTPDL